MTKNDSGRVVDLLNYKNHYVPNKKSHVFIGKEDKKYICRRCLKSYTNQDVLISHAKTWSTRGNFYKLE